MTRGCQSRGFPYYPQFICHICHTISTLNFLTKFSVADKLSVADKKIYLPHIKRSNTNGLEVSVADGR